MVRASGQGKSNTDITQEEQDHAALNDKGILGREIAHLGNLAGNHQRANQECRISCYSRNQCRVKYVKQMQGVENEHYRKRNNDNPGNVIIRIAGAGMTVNEDSLEHHEEANSQQSVVGTVFKKMRHVVKDLEADIGTEGAKHTQLEQSAVALADAVLATEEQCHNGNEGGNRELGVMLEVAGFLQALFYGATLVKHVPVTDKEGDGKNGNNGNNYSNMFLGDHGAKNIFFFTFYA